MLVFHLNPATAVLTATSPKSFRGPAGGGPRHFAIHPGGKFAFMNNEMGSSVTAFALDSSTGSLHEMQTVSTLPGGKMVDGNSTAEMLCHPNGRFLYVSNRGHDSIAVYQIAANGHLLLVEIASAGVKIPRGFGIDATGRWLVVAGQNSNDLTSLAIDSATGKLRPTDSKVHVSQPVCVVFAKN